MGTLTNSLMRLLLGWVQGIIGLLWTLPNGQAPSALRYLSEPWLPLPVTLIVFGLVMDRIVWFIRWQPYRLWAARIRRRLGIAESGADAGGFGGRTLCAAVVHARKDGCHPLARGV